MGDRGDLVRALVVGCCILVSTIFLIRKALDRMCLAARAWDRQTALSSAHPIEGPARKE